MNRLLRPNALFMEFKLNVANAVSRSLYDKLQEQGANIKDFGAKVDGVTDDADAIIRAVNSGYTRITMPQGVSVSTKTINIPSGVRLIGAGTDYWDTFCPVGNPLRKSMKHGSHILFKGTGLREHEAPVLAHNVPDKVIDGVTYRLTDFTNKDSVSGFPATARKFSVGIIVKNNSQLKDIRIVPWFNGIDGYNDKVTTELADDWDVGVWCQGSNESSIDGIQAVGYWRMMGCLFTENDGSYEACGSNPERTRFSKSLFQGVRGMSVRNAPQWSVSGQTTDSITCEWNKTWTLTSQDKFKIVGSELTFSFTGYTFNSGTNEVTLTGVTPALPTNAIIGIRSPSIGNNLSGSVLNDCLCASLEHSSCKPSEEVGLPIAGALEVNGYPLRGMKFINTKIQTTYDKLNTIFGDCRDFKFVAGQFENGALIAYDRTQTKVSFTENLRMTNTYANSGTLNRTGFTPRGYFNDYDSFNTEFSRGNFDIHPSMKGLPDASVSMYNSMGLSRFTYGGTVFDTTITTGRNFIVKGDDGVNKIVMYNSGNITFHGAVTASGLASPNKGSVGTNTLPFGSLHLHDVGTNATVEVYVSNGVLKVR